MANPWDTLKFLIPTFFALLASHFRPRPRASALCSSLLEAGLINMIIPNLLSRPQR